MPKAIINNLEHFSEKMLDLVADDSKNGQASLSKIIEQARKEYKTPIDSYIYGWIYQYTRLRVTEVDNTIADLKTTSDTVLRLKEFKALINIGEWHEGSFNHCLFKNLIHAIPDYEPLKANEVIPVIAALKKMLTSQIDVFIRQYVASKKLIEDKQKELNNTHQTDKKSTDQVLISNDLNAAKSTAIEKTNKILFCLAQKNGVWKLSWVDSIAVVYPLELNEELVHLLSSSKVCDVVQLKAISVNRLKIECLKIRNAFLDKTQVLINPNEDQVLMNKGSHSSFILRGEPGQYRLWWINTIGVEKKLSLEAYPAMLTWLNAQPELSENHLPQLKSFLVQINTASKSVGLDSFKKQLADCLGHNNHAQSTIKAKTELKTQKDLPQIKRIDLSLFADLERVIGGQQQEVVEAPLEEVLEGAVQVSNDIKPAPGRLNLEKYKAVAGLFNTDKQSEPQKDTEIEFNL